MMSVFSGKGVYGAIAAGKISLFRRQNLSIKCIHCEDTDKEKQRVAKARECAKARLVEIYKKAVEEVGESNAAIFEAHILMLEDEDYKKEIEQIIERQQVNAEYAVKAATEQFANVFGQMDDAYMKARAADVRDVSRQMLNNLCDCGSEYATTDEKVIICAEDLAPSETVLLDKEKVIAIVTAGGSVNSHTAILARNMNIPAIIGVGATFFDLVLDGDDAIVDGFTGEIFLHPDLQTRERLFKKKQDTEERKKRLQNLKGKENVTMDGRKIQITANIEEEDELDEVLFNDAGGIGLFRSEFLFLKNRECPTEEQQFLAYKKVLERMDKKRVIVRTLDIGADKQAEYLNLPKEKNPALGCRAIRLCFKRQELLKTQLRALFRASVYGNLGVMFPMLTSVWELEKLINICDEVKKELEKEGISYAGNIELGIMIETPAAAIISDRLAPFVDFFSVGTNDLTQYTLACDRQNPDMEEFVDTHHEAVLRLIELSAENAHKHGIWIGICGELASDVTLTETFLNMGIDELSVSPSMVLQVRDVVRKLGG